MRCLIVVILLAGCQADAVDGKPGWGAPDAGPQPDMGLPRDRGAELFAEWSGCMQLADFDAAIMTAWARVPTVPGNLCADCHSNGYHAFIANDESPMMFGQITTNQEMLARYFTVDAGLTEVIVNHNAFDNVAAGVNGHPQFDPVGNKGMVALEKFQTATALQKSNGTCMPPRLIPAS
jgi:hypothetical protein